MTDKQSAMFSLAASGAAPALVTEEEIDFDAEPAVRLPVEQDEPQGASLQSAGARQDEQRADRVHSGQPQSSDEQKRAEKSNGEPAQGILLNIPEWWEEHWKGMPEFKQEDLMPWKTLYVHFKDRADMEAFAKFVGQSIRTTTKSIWWPQAEKAQYADMRWIAATEAADAAAEAVAAEVEDEP